MIIWGNISFVIALLADIFIAYIKLNPISPSVLSWRTCKFCRQHQHLLRHCSNHLMIWSNSGNDGPGCHSSWGIYSLTTSFSFPSQLFWPYFDVTNLCSLGSPQTFLNCLKGSSYCEKDYSNGEVNAVEISQTRLHKLKKNVAIASCYYLFSKIWKKNSICCYKKEKTPGLCCFLSAKN